MRDPAHGASMPAALEDHLKARSREQASVVEVNARLAAAVDVGAALEPILERLAERSGFSRVSIYELDSATGLLRCVSESDLRTSQAGHPGRPDPPGLVAWAARSGQSAYVPDATSDPRSRGDVGGTGSQYTVPLLKDSSVVGVLHVQSEELDGIRAVSRKLLDQIAAQIALALERSEFRKKLRNSDERFRAVFEEEHFGVALSDLAGRYTAVNPAFARPLGYEPEEMRGRLALDFISPEDRPRCAESWKVLSEGGEAPGVLEARLVHKAGHALPGKSVISVLRDAAGYPAELLEIRENLADRKNAEDERTLLREQLFQAAEDGRGWDAGRRLGT